MVDERVRERTVLCWLALLPLLLLDLFPFIAMLTMLLRPDATGASPSNWKTAADFREEMAFGSALLNSFYAALLSSAASTLVSVPAAYAMSRYRFRLSRPFGNLLLLPSSSRP